MHPNNSTNLRNRVNKLYLPVTKALYPLFEVISNSIHAIEEKFPGENNKGIINIHLIRNGKVETLESLDNIEDYPINSFLVEDNGIGLNDENLKSFSEFDSEKKALIGGKGVGRLICLKAFEKLIIDSNYLFQNYLKNRSFNYKKSKDGFEHYIERISNSSHSGTKVTLYKFEKKYENKISKNILEIARQIITHFQLYFIQKIDPEIILKNQNGEEVVLSKLFDKEFEKEILSSSFIISDKEFNIYITKSYEAKSHKIYYCAHQRNVKDEGLSKYLEDLKFKINNQDSAGYYFQVFVVSQYLDTNVNEARTSFNFTIEDDSEENEEISLAKIRKESLNCIENLLSETLSKLRKEKLERYIPIINNEYPNYKNVVKNNLEKVKKLPLGLNNQELDLKLYEIESDWKREVKAEGIELIEQKKDISNLDEYQELYSKFLSNFNEVGQTELARYVIHRRSVIDLLEKLIELNEEDKFQNEDIVHSLFFPIRETGESVPHDNQNLWLLDERLTYNSFLASDKLFKQITELNSTSSKRIDLMIKKEDIFDKATLFSENKIPFESFTIVEFKRPERDNYTHGIYEKDPVKQVRTYIEETINGKVKIRGKRIDADNRTPFYCYIIADLTPSLISILDYESFVRTPDGLGYFKFYETKNSKAYIEVLPFKKIIKDAKQRNKVLFDKLELS
ncbi:ATP-binding protein [Flavobacteriaceae bacterium Ap0902]|nr:ATP-binding protein [Flavobacteriaceae bacterium Ap0902]